MSAAKANSSTRSIVGPILGCLLSLVLITAALVLIGSAILWSFRGAAWLAAEASSHAGAIGWVVLVPILVWLGIEVVGRRNAQEDPASEPGGQRRAGTILPLCLSSAVIAGNGCLNIAAARVESFWESRRKDGVDIYRNHDLAKLVGGCVRLAILRHAQSIPKARDVERRGLETIAAIAPEQWQRMTGADGVPADPRVLALADAKLTQFIQEPRARALHLDDWISLLREWRGLAKAEPVSDTALSAAAETVAADFGITLREALKADFEKGGKAWAAMQVDIAQSLLNKSPVVGAGVDAAMKAALVEVRDLLKDDAAGLPALHRTIMDVRQAQEAHARDVTRSFDQVLGLLARIQADVTAIRAQAAASLSNDAINARIKQIDLEPSLSVDEKRALMNPLLTQIINNQPADARPAEVPEPVQQIVERTFAEAPKIVRFAALARVGLEKEADELADEIERTTMGLSDADKYEFFVARGDRYWGSGNYWSAAAWYAQAMALRVDDSAVVHRAARSAALAPGRETFTQDIQLAESWVERALARLAAKGEASSVEGAQLHATLAILLCQHGRSPEAVGPARDALRLLAEVNDAPSGAACPALVAAADALQFAGCLSEAALAADRALAAAHAYAGPASDADAMASASRARIRQLCGDLDGAEHDIARSIAWGENQVPRNERNLVIRYAVRARIRLARGDLVVAGQDIGRSIELGERLSPRDERGLAIDYSMRASIRQLRGDLAGAEEDIARCIQYFEKQTPRDERELAVHYASRAIIRQDCGRPGEAERDITRSIDWFETQVPRDERSLAIWYSWRAGIRKDRGLLTEAEKDINRSIGWSEAQTPRDERSLAIDYASRARISEAQAAAARMAGRVDKATRLYDHARADIRAALGWWLTNLPRDERGIGILREDAARIEAAARGD